MQTSRTKNPEQLDINSRQRTRFWNIDHDDDIP